MKLTIRGDKPFPVCRRVYHRIDMYQSNITDIYPSELREKRSIQWGTIDHEVVEPLRGDIELSRIVAFVNERL